MTMPTLTRTLTWTALAALVLSPMRASAHGALAVGLPDDVAKKGVAIGISFDYGSRADAEERALKECRAFDAPAATRELCKVVDVFVNECLVVALGGPGVGWAIGGRSAATELAVQRCAESAGEAERGACKVSEVRCDGKP